MEKLLISKVVVVEGKYDKITLENVIDAFILTTDGFGIFKNEEKLKKVLNIIAIVFFSIFIALMVLLVVANS